MSGGLATRCPSCGTVFRVVADQLRVSEGWVRCGRCAEVFNAGERLLDLGSVTASAPMPLQQPDETTASATEALQAPPPAAAPEEPTGVVDFELTLDPPPETPPEPPLQSTPETAAAALPDPHELFDPPDSGAKAPAPDAADSATDIGMTPAGRTPTFMRRAERAERWRTPRVRLALGVATLVGTVLLFGQVLYTYRDLAAARFAGLRGPLEAACEALGCRVGAAHAIESLAVESSGLVRVEKSSVYKLSVAVRNRAGIEVAVPALDLTLTDAQGKLLARRVIRASEFGVATNVVAAGSDLLFQATLQAGTEPITGYTIDLFYP